MNDINMKRDALTISQVPPNMTSHKEEMTSHQEHGCTPVSLDVSVLVCVIALLLVIKCTVLHVIQKKKRQGEMSGIITGAALNLDKITTSTRDLNISELPGDIAISVACFSTAYVALFSTSLPLHPFSIAGFSSLLHYTLLVCTANSLFRTVTSFLGSRVSDNGGGERILTSYVNYPLALVVYLTVLVSGENGILGVAGISYQVSFTFAFLLRSLFGNNFMTSLLATIAYFIFSLVLPLVCFLLSMLQERLSSTLSLWSTAVFGFSVVYFGLFAIWMISKGVYDVHNKVVVSSQRSFEGKSAVSEKTGLLSEGSGMRQDIHLKGNVC